MFLSGIKMEEDVVKYYEDFRFKKEPGGLILKIEDEAIHIEKEVNGDFDQLAAELPDAEPRFVLYDVPMQNRAKIDALKTIFLFWLPMESPVRKRMVYASSKSIIVKEFRGISAQLQEDEKDALTTDNIIYKVNRQQGINNTAL